MSKKNREKSPKKSSSLILFLRMFLLAFVISIAMSTVTESVLDQSALLFSLVILFIVVAIGVIFDIIGMAVATCEKAPFHSMAAKKNIHAVFALKLINRAPFVTSLCNDVVGDIANIVSGAAIGNIVYSLLRIYSRVNVTWLSVLMSAVVAAMTVGAKALGKEIAAVKSKEITLAVGKTIYIADYIFTFKWVKEIGR